MDAPKIRIDLGYTLNVGNYESLKIGISVEDSARKKADGQESVNEAFNRIYSFVEAKLGEKLNEAKQVLQ